MQECHIDDLKNTISGITDKLTTLFGKLGRAKADKLSKEQAAKMMKETEELKKKKAEY